MSENDQYAEDRGRLRPAEPNWLEERQRIVEEAERMYKVYELRLNRQIEAITRLTADRRDLFAMCHSMLDGLMPSYSEAYIAQFDAIRERIRKNG